MERGSNMGYGIDCDEGRKLARERLCFIAEHPTAGASRLLPIVVHDMAIQTGRRCWSGIEPGLIIKINEATMIAAGRMEAITVEDGAEIAPDGAASEGAPLPSYVLPIAHHQEAQRLALSQQHCDFSVRRMVQLPRLERGTS